MAGFNCGLVLLAIIQVSYGAYMYMKPNVPPPFSYEGETGPKNWCKLPGSSQCCSTDYSRQSPIDIRTNKMKKLYTDIDYAGYSRTPTLMDISNNGHTVVVGYSTSTDAIPTITNGPLNTNYRYHLESIHLHWGPDIENGGAEHLVNGLRYPMEMHLVHYNNLYNSTMQAQNYDNGLAVLAVLISISKYDNPAFSSLVDNLRKIRYKGSRSIIDSMVLADLLPDYPAFFYSYSGSLTTPPCSEKVTWIVFTKAVTMSEYQMNEFRKLQEVMKSESYTKNKPILKNFRPIQRLNNRDIYVWMGKKTELPQIWQN